MNIVTLSAVVLSASFYANLGDFTYFPIPKTHKDAQNVCKSVGGNLASIISEEHRDSVVNMIEDDSVWIGLYSERKIGWFIFEDKTAECPNIFSGACVDFWRLGHPRCIEKNKGYKCTSFYPVDDVIDNDINCNREQPFICSDSKAPGSDPTKAPLTTTPTTTAPTTKAPTTNAPITAKTYDPTTDPIGSPSTDPTRSPSSDPTQSPSADPTRSPSTDPTRSPSTDPTSPPSICNCDFCSDTKRRLNILGFQPPPQRTNDDLVGLLWIGHKPQNQGPVAINGRGTASIISDATLLTAAHVLYGHPNDEDDSYGHGDPNIAQGFKWNGNSVWLQTENKGMKLPVNKIAALPIKCTMVDTNIVNIVPFVGPDGNQEAYYEYRGNNCRWYIPQQWIDRAASAFDFAVIETEELIQLLPNQSPLTVGSIPPITVTVVDELKLVGYPWNDLMGKGRLEFAEWTDLCKMKMQVPQRIFHECDTLPGSSGAPISIDICEDNNAKPTNTRVVIGVHTNGGKPNTGNIGVKINEIVLDYIMIWSPGTVFFPVNN